MPTTISTQLAKEILTMMSEATITEIGNLPTRKARKKKFDDLVAKIKKELE